MWNIVGSNKIHSTAIIGDNVIMGDNNIIYPYVVIGLPGFIRDVEVVTGVINIGNNNKIGNYVSIMCGVSGTTQIGSNNLIMHNVNIGHDVSIGDDNEIGVSSILSGWCKIGNKNKIKLNVSVRNRIIIGDNNIIGMGSNVVANIDNNTVSYGNPNKIIRENK
jgi:UDP-3-O-[3-hydroxymyristoyl] glucosamine N-acyltransferase